MECEAEVKVCLSVLWQKTASGRSSIDQPKKTSTSTFPWRATSTRTSPSTWSSSANLCSTSSTSSSPVCSSPSWPRSSITCLLTVSAPPSFAAYKSLSATAETMLLGNRRHLNELAFQMKKSTHILNISACFAAITWKGKIHSCRCRGCVIKSTRLKLVIMTPPKEQIYILFFNKSSKIYKPFY